MRFMCLSPRFVDDLRGSEGGLSVEYFVEEIECDVHYLIQSARKHLDIDPEAYLTFYLLTRVHFSPVF